MDRLTKRLIGCMQYGITISSDDGHRWISLPHPDSFGSHLQDELLEGLEITGLSLINKVYGSYEEALDRVDYLLVSLGLIKTEEVYIDFGEV